MSGYFSKAFIDLVPAQRVLCRGIKFQITRVISANTVLARNIEAGTTERLFVEDLRLDPTHDLAHERALCSLDLADYPEEKWAIAQQRYKAIKPLLDEPLRIKREVETLAKLHNVNAATLYRWAKRFREAGHISALIPVKTGRTKGTTLLDPELEAVVTSAIEDLFLNKQRFAPADVVMEIRARCRKAGLQPPHPNTVRNRIMQLNAEHVLRRRGRRDLARNRFAAIKGSFPDAEFPFAVVQIDHTPTDVILVDEAYRKPIGKAWLTLAIDVYSRMVAGMYLSFETPSEISVGVCLANAICPKREYLAERGVSGEWPVWGVMRTVHADNGKDFRGAMLRRACEEYAIDLQMRPVMEPHYGGHIERLMGTMANEERKLPGATFAAPWKRKGYDSEREAAMTLREFEQQILDFIVNMYHQRVHSTLGMSPLKRWEDALIGPATEAPRGLMQIPSDPVRVHIDFLPFEERSVQQYGIQIDEIQYYDRVLDPYISAVDPDNDRRKRKFTVRRDPRDISSIYFFDPATQAYFRIPYRNRSHPPISLWELREVKKELKRLGVASVNESLIFETYERMKARVASAIKKTKSARRAATRIPVQAANPEGARQIGPTSTSARKATPPEQDPFALPLQPFDERRVLP